MVYSPIGLILDPHGLRGEIRVRSLAGDLSEFFEKDNSVFVRLGLNYRQFCVTSCEAMKKGLFILKLDGIDSIDQADFLKSFNLFIEGEIVEEVVEDVVYSIFYRGKEYFSSDIVDNGGYELLVLKDTDGKEMFVPFNDDFIESVDDVKKVIVIKEIEGLDEI